MKTTKSLCGIFPTLMFAVCLLFTLCPDALAQDRAYVLEVTAATSATSPCITLSWQAGTGSTSLWKRQKGAADWGSSITVSGNTYADAGASPGVAYEYSLVRGSTYGGIVAGYNIPLVEARGKVILLVDNTMSVPLAPELSQLERDLVGDGWQVLRHDVPRQSVSSGYVANDVNATPPNAVDAPVYAQRIADQSAIRNMVKADCATDPTANWALFIFGNVPVPYSGNMAPDGHSGHVGAWPTDMYYADISDTAGWTDAQTRSVSATDPRNRNVPADGKFDQTTIPTDAKLIQNGRVDMVKMTQVPSGVSELKLLRQYLVRDHRFRKGIAPYDAVARRMIVDDNFLMGFSISGWEAGISFFGRNPGQVDALDWFTTLRTTPMLMAYGSGSGDWIAATGVGNSTVEFALYDSKAVFCMLFGSWFGDWECNNNFLRAPLAGTYDSLGLADVWSGRGSYQLFHMGLGENIGYSVRYTQAVTQVSGNWYQGYERYVHTALMGDPTLRLHTVKPPTNVSVSSTGGGAVLSWTASPDIGVSGYHVYRAAATGGPFVRLSGSAATAANPTGSPLNQTSFTDTTGIANTAYTYMVRAVKMESSPSGTYANQSVGDPISFTYLPLTPTFLTPSDLTVVGTGQATYLLQWRDNSTDETGFQVERRDPTTYAWSLIATLGANVTTFTDPVAPTSDVVHYRVRAMRDATLSGYTDAVGDSNPRGFVRFVDPFRLVNSGGVSQIAAIRYSGSQGTTSLGYFVTPILGTQGVDYAVSGALSWPHGDTTNKNVSVDTSASSGPQLTKLLKIYTTANAFNTVVQIQDPASQVLPGPWTSQAFGSVQESGYAEHVGGVFGVSARTGTIGGTTDSCRFLYAPIIGDCQITARVSFLSTALTPSMSAGLMIRSTLAPTSQMSSILLASSGMTAMKRLTDSASVSTTTQAGVIAPSWVRIKRTGNAVDVSYSADGTTWNALGSTATLSGLGSTAYIGFSMASGTVSGDIRGYAQYDNVSVSATPTAPPTLTAALGNAGEVNLTWAPGGNAQYYLLERSTTSGAGFAQIAQIDGASTTYKDSGLTNGLTYYYRVRSLIGAERSAYSPEAGIQIVLPENISGWRYFHFGIGDNSGIAANLANPSGDGIVNMVKYATGLDPAKSTLSGISAEVVPISGTDYLTLTFTRLKSANDMKFTVQASNSLNGTWTLIDPLLPANQLGVSDDTPSAGLETITVKDIQPLSASISRFMRLRVLPVADMQTHMNFNMVGASTRAAPNYSGAAVIGAAGDVWNNLNSATALLLTGVKDASGTTVPGVSFSMTGGENQYWASGATESIWYGSAQASLMTSYVYSAANVVRTVTVSGLKPKQEFNLYIYSSSGGAANAAIWNTVFTVSAANGGGTASSTNGKQSPPATFVQGKNYVLFPGIVAADGTVSFTFYGPTVQGNFNGFQLQYVY